MGLKLYGVYDENDAGMLNALQLAYVGDAVWEVIIRDALIHREMTVHHMHGACVEYVNAHAQAAFLQQIQAGLSEKEAEIARRGRNAHARHPAPRNQDPGDYAAATGFEALIGFLYLTGQEERIMTFAGMIIGGEKNG